MNKLRIRTEAPPRRCEICHQSDLFDAAQNHCERCKDIQLEQRPQRKKSSIIGEFLLLAIFLFPVAGVIGGAIFAGDYFLALKIALIVTVSVSLLILWNSYSRIDENR